MLYVFSPVGLFPAPLGHHAKTSVVTRVKSKFHFLGRFMAKALMDSRLVSVGFRHSLSCNVTILG